MNTPHPQRTSQAPHTRTFSPGSAVPVEALARRARARTHTLTHTHKHHAAHAVPAEALAQFDMSEEERRFKGDEDDRKALMEHRCV